MLRMNRVMSMLLITALVWVRLDWLSVRSRLMSGLILRSARLVVVVIMFDLNFVVLWAAVLIFGVVPCVLSFPGGGVLQGRVVFQFGLLRLFAFRSWCSSCFSSCVGVLFVLCLWKVWGLRIRVVLGRRRR